MGADAEEARDDALREALAAWRRGDEALALARCRAALALDAGCARAWTVQGLVLRSRDPAAAEAALLRAMALDPRDPDAAFHLGNLLRDQRQFARAIDAYEHALALAPRHPSLLNNLGLTLEAAGEHARAERALRAALAYAPQHAQARRNLAHVLCAMRRYEEALPLLEAHLQREGRDDVDAWVDYGIALHHVRDYARAEGAFLRALAGAPDDALILTDLGSLLVDCMQFERALPVLAQALERDPGALYASSLLAYCRQQLCAWDDLAALHARIAQALDAGSDAPVNAFAALSMPMSARAQRRVAQRWARDLADAAPAAPPAGEAIHPGRPRLAYVSSDFGTHPTAFLLTEVWERHDRARFETFAYAIGAREASPLRTRIEAAFDHFVDCSAMSVEAITRRIREDRIDLLVDLNGYTTHARSEIFVTRPAAVQLSWLGYLGTLGAPWYDYVVTDRFVTPEDQQPLFTERFLYLPDCYCPSDTRREVAANVPGRTQCGLPAQGFVFCCFNNQYKILPSMFEVWMRILGAVPGSVLWLSPASAAASANLRREATLRGVDAGRLIFAPRVPMPEHLARHAHADLFLDTAPYNAGATANDALFAGLPLLTVAGATMASRVAASQLHAIGLPELVASDLGEYEALAVALARSSAPLAGYRRRLAANRSTHPLFDMARFVARLEDALTAVLPPRAR